VDDCRKDEAILKSQFNGFVMVVHINENIKEFLINVNIMVYLTILSTMEYLAIASTTGSLTILSTMGFLTIANTKEFLTILSITAHLIMKNIKEPLIFTDEEVIHNQGAILEFTIKSNQKILALSQTIITHQYQIVLHNF
jgi:hypothetical protein